MKLRVLVCGGTGFIGTNLVNKFKKRKNIILTATYLKSSPTKDKSVKWIKADLRNKTKVYKIIKDQDIIIQAAATTSGAKDILNKPYLHVTDNAIMNSLILQACYDLKVSRFIEGSDDFYDFASEEKKDWTENDDVKFWSAIDHIVPPKVFLIQKKSIVLHSSHH